MNLPLATRQGPIQPYVPKDTAIFRPRDDEVFANEFGVAADGTDQTVNLGRAISAANSRGKTLVIPPGTFHALDLTLPAGTAIRGFGPKTILRRPSTGVGGLSNVLRVTGSNVTISDLTVDGNRAALAQADNRGVIDGFTAGVNNVVIERVWVTEGAEKGIRMVDHGTDLVIRDCRVTNIDEDAIIVQQSANDGSGVTISRNRVDGCSGNGIMVRGSNDGTTRFQRVVTIDNNRVTNVTGLCIESWCEDSTITGNVTVGGTFGISNGPGMRTAITGNTVRDASTIGIEAAATDNAEWVTCSGNVVVGAGVCISASAGADHVVISGNSVDYTGTTHAIHTVLVNTAIVTGNRVRTTTNAQYVIRFQSGVTAICCNNMIDHTAANGGIGDNGIFFGDIEEFVCGNNAVKNCSFGIRLVSATATYDGTIGDNLLIGNTDPYDQALSGSATATGLVFGENRPTIP